MMMKGFLAAFEGRLAEMVGRHDFEKFTLNLREMGGGGGCLSSSMGSHKSAHG
jgi:hypothetical protein